MITLWDNLARLKPKYIEVLRWGADWGVIYRWKWSGHVQVVQVIAGLLHDCILAMLARLLRWQCKHIPCAHVDVDCILELVSAVSWHNLSLTTAPPKFDWTDPYSWLDPPDKSERGLLEMGVRQAQENAYGLIISRFWHSYSQRAPGRYASSEFVLLSVVWAIHRYWSFGFVWDEIIRVKVFMA